jgi:hypothetical protein
MTKREAKKIAKLLVDECYSVNQETEQVYVSKNMRRIVPNKTKAKIYASIVQEHLINVFDHLAYLFDDDGKTWKKFIKEMNNQEKILNEIEEL